MLGMFSWDCCDTRHRRDSSSPSCEGSSFAKTFVGTPQYWAPEASWLRWMRCCSGPLSGYGIEMNDRYIDGIEQWFGFSFPPFLSLYKDY